MTVLFLDGSRAAHDVLRGTVSQLLDVLAATEPAAPFPAISPDQLASEIAEIDPLPDSGVPLAEVLAEIGETVLARGARTADSRCVAHLHSPTLLPAAAAELAIGATNQSMDSFDQAPAATYVEDALVRRLADFFGLPTTASGVLTAGGTASNLLGLLLARHRVAPDAVTGGLPADAACWRIVASEAAHASVRQAAAVLGLGREAVVPIATDGAGRMELPPLDERLTQLRASGERVVALVGTAGTTDAGAIDPLDALADRAAAEGCWLHVDAAVGSALALSDQLRPRLAGLERADSITADLHKLWWQPIGASALLVRDGAAWRGLREPADYLNRADDDGVLNLVDRSLDTSRRFDALKVLVSLRTTGRRRLGELLEQLVALAGYAGEQVRERSGLELLAEPQTVTVLFRCRPEGVPAGNLDELNAGVQRDLLSSGQAVVGRTRYRGQTALKLTLVNPLARRADVDRVLDLIAVAATRRGAPAQLPAGVAP